MRVGAEVGFDLMHSLIGLVMDDDWIKTSGFMR